MIKAFLLNQLNNLIKELIIPRTNMQITISSWTQYKRNRSITGYSRMITPIAGYALH